MNSKDYYFNLVWAITVKVYYLGSTCGGITLNRVDFYSWLHESGTGKVRYKQILNWVLLLKTPSL